MKVLVTGAGGSLGYHLCLALLDDGFTVRVPEADSRGTDLEGLGIETAPGGSEPESLASALIGVNAVFDCGFSRQTWPPGNARKSLETTGNLLVAMSRSGVERLVHVGTALCFEPGGLSEPGDEDGPRTTPLFGLDCLRAARQAQDNVLRFNDSEKVRAVVVNPTVLFGSHDAGGSIASALFERAASGGEVPPPGGINVIGAADAGRAALRALGRGRAGLCYILGGSNVSYSDLFETMSGGSRKPIGVGPGASRRRPPRERFLDRGADRLAGEITSRGLYYSNSRAATGFGLEPAPLEQVVGEAREWWNRGKPH